MHRQLIMNIIDLFTPQSKVDFYTKIFDTLDLSEFPDEVNSGNSGPDGFSRHALFRAFMVMKCEKFSEITQLQEYLFNNQIIAHICGFDITKRLPSYWTYRRFIKNTAHKWFTAVMKSQVKILVSLGYIDGSFVSLDSINSLLNFKFLPDLSIGHCYAFFTGFLLVFFLWIELSMSILANSFLFQGHFTLKSFNMLMSNTNTK